MIGMPLARIAPGSLRRLAVPASIVYGLAFLPFLFVGEPQEMVRLQFAGSVSRAREIVATWSRADVVDMAFLQGVDSVHPLAYGLLLATGAVWAGRRLKGRAAQQAPIVAWMALAAASFDLLENVGMIAMIRGHIEGPVPTITTSFAVAKFLIFLVVVPYVMAGLVARLRGGRVQGAV